MGYRTKYIRFSQILHNGKILFREAICIMEFPLMYNVTHSLDVKQFSLKLSYGGRGDRDEDKN